ncbi:hypothetical protein MJO29_014429 [Puccinia striiformis f. sp. tritici]|uniref:hypothetical protein n=1 Tax=Puccinia striiformis f. sp. tritici TaxID=168172 RepID=UPI0020077F8D|nr:hypothetical protein Pst134EA_027030 [Puccinia striiformis f. sp. tritici]KAH9450322.1 hypothetical protein Pst134EA_027030 [Puccinia striiformis f. sp. tritici]KAI7939693.1 hypothetical protein MJO29_014429 [Puccinia striiformis f. sp. tritici]KAI9629963.1 hypothetical protein KEM48_012372 [Puccinia striiformis f. sp. tritici PST-130]
MGVSKSEKRQHKHNAEKKQTHHSPVTTTSKPKDVPSNLNDQTMEDAAAIVSDWEEDTSVEEPKLNKQKLFNKGEEDSNMYDSNVQFKPELTNKTITTRDYGDTFAAFKDLCSPFFRFCSARSTHPDFNPLAGEPTLRAKNQIGCWIRAIGLNSHVDDVESVGVKNGLQRLSILPQLLQKISHTEWPNEWIVHLTLDDALKFPKYFDLLTKGMFYGFSKDLTYYCIVTPLLPKDYTVDGLYPRGTISIPATLAINPGRIPEIIKTDLKLVQPNDEEDTSLEVIKVVHQADRMGERVMMTGEYIVHICCLLQRTAGERFWLSNQKSMMVQLDDQKFKFTFNQYCMTCGFEEHVHVKNCPYSFALSDLYQRHNKLTSNSGAQATEYAHNIHLIRPDSGPEPKQSHPGPSKSAPSVKGKGKQQQTCQYPFSLISIAMSLEKLELT